MRLILVALTLLLLVPAASAQVNTYVDSFTWNAADAATTNYVRTGYGFKARAAIVWTSGNGSAIDAITAQDIRQSYGLVALESTGPDVITRRAISNWADEAAATTAAVNRMEDAACVVIMTAGPTIDGLLDVTAIGTDGITFTVDDQVTADVRVHVWAIGGADITDAEIGTTLIPSTAQTQSVSVTFQPEVVFTMQASNGTPPLNSTSMYQTLGFGLSTTQRAAVMGNSYTASAAADSQGYALSLNAAGYIDPDPFIRASGITLTAPGFDIVWAEVTGTTYRFFWLAINGGQWFIGESTTRTDTTQFAVGGFGHQPKGMFFISAMRAESTDNVSSAHWQWSIGAASTPSNRGAMSSRDQDLADPSNLATAVEHDAVYASINLTTDTIDGLMDLVSFDADGATFIMDDADPSANWFGFVSVGQAAAGPTPAHRRIIGNGGAANLGQSLWRDYAQVASILCSIGLP